jgi:WD40 repeat protein
VTVSALLNKFIRQRRKADVIKPPDLHRLPELSLLETWALDLLKVTAKFGNHLNSHPEAIYKYIPPLCSQNSMLYQISAKKPTATISVAGLSYMDWDDCLARVSDGSDSALHVAVSARFLAVANDSPNGKIQLWSNVIFQEHRGFSPGEPICCISFSQSGSLLACNGLDNTFVWRVSDGSLIVALKRTRRLEK